MKLLRDLMLAGALAATALPALADRITTYTIDPTHTQVHFSWTHVGFSNPGAVFRDVTGTILGNQDHPEKSSVQVIMPVASVDSFVPLLNEHLIQSGDYFKAKEFPTVMFKSTGIRNVNKEKRTFTLDGELTVNGITKPVSLAAKANAIGEHPFYEKAAAAGFDATTTLKRSDFGMGKYVPMVSDELQVRITVEAVEANAYRIAQEKQAAAAKK
ncbi:MAG: YceI family protein [Moraxellaceae bacterium]|nr:YceI family protein [Moraxellaceae bacterium]